MLARRIAALPEDAPLATDLDALLEDALPVNPIVIALGEVVSKLDATTEEHQWTQGTQPFSTERRDVACRLLGLPPKSIGELARLRPVMHLRRPTVISEEFTRWYTRERATEREFYWPCYRNYLRNKRNWTELDLRSLDLASDEVIERLADPLAPQPRRGLVVGHVQSGKTANFTGVIAKAVDQGYRLVIVLAGMQEPLRRQTQRRLDMELLGRPNILLDLTELQAVGTPQGEYQDDPLWDEDMFSDLEGSKPRPEILRLTFRSSDFRQIYGELPAIQGAR